MLGVLASRTLTALAVYALVGSVGTLLLAVGLFDETAARRPRSTTSSTARWPVPRCSCWPTSSPRRRGGAGDRLVAAPPFAQLDLLAGLFFLAAIATVGLPPLSGFVGKLLILEALRDRPHWALALGRGPGRQPARPDRLRPRRQRRVLEVRGRARRARARPAQQRHGRASAPRRPWSPDRCCWRCSPARP